MLQKHIEASIESLLDQRSDPDAFQRNAAELVTLHSEIRQLMATGAPAKELYAKFVRFWAYFKSHQNRIDFPALLLILDALRELSLRQNRKQAAKRGVIFSAAELKELFSVYDFGLTSDYLAKIVRIEEMGTKLFF